MDFSKLKDLIIPEGVVTKITVGDTVLWERPLTAFNVTYAYTSDSTFGSDYAQGWRIWEFTPDGEEVGQDMEWTGYTVGNTIQLACEDGVADTSNYIFEWRMYDENQTSYTVIGGNDYMVSFVMPAYDVKIEAKVTLVNTECVHEYVYQYTQDPTCIAQGYDVYQCSKCGEYAYYNYVEPSDDKHDYKLIDSGDVSCESAGYNKYKCNLCGNEYIEITEYAPGHDWRESWQEVEGGHAHICDRCGAESEVKSHTWGDWIGVAAGHYRECTACGAKSPTYGHDPLGTVLEEANCIHGTYYSFNCVDCGYHIGKWYEGEPLGDLGHKKPDTWSDGGDGCVKYCTICGALVEGKEHDWSNNDGYCSDCGAECTHSWVTEDGKPTYCSTCGKVCAHDWRPVNDGDPTTHLMKCSICGEEGGRDYHNWKTWDDLSGQYCTECGYSYDYGDDIQ